MSYLPVRSRLTAPLLLTALVACAGGQDTRPPAPVLPSPPGPPSPCAVAAAQRARVPGLLGEGRLDRVVRVLDRADALCPASASAGWAARVSALSELGRKDEARKVVAAIEASAEAPAAARAAAKAAGEAMAATDPRSAEALFQAGSAAAAKGERAEAQRLFDRALVEAQRATGKSVILEPPPGRSAQRGFAWSKDGGVLAVIAHHGVSIRDKQAGFREARRLEGPEGDVTVVAFSPDGKTLAAGAEDNTVRLWDVTTWAEVRRLVHRTDQREMAPDVVTSVAFSPDGKTLASATGNGANGGNIRLWDPATGAELRELEGPRSGGTPVVFSADGQTLAADSWQEGVHTWSVKTGRLLPPPRAVALISAASPDGGALAERSMREVLRRWSLRPGREPRDAKSAVAAYASSLDGKSMAVALGSGDRVIHLLSVADGVETQHLRADDLPSSLAFSPDGKAVFAIFKRGIRIWDTATGAHTGMLEGDPSQVDFSPDSATVAAEDSNGVSLVSVATGRVTRLARLRSDEGQSSLAALSPDGKMVATGSSDHGVRLWEIAPRPSMRKLGEHTSTVSAVAFSPDGKTLASCNERSVRLWSTATGREVRKLESFGAVSVAFSPDGKTLASGGTNTVRLRDVADSSESKRFEVPRGSSIRHVAFSRDGRTLAASTNEGTLRLWDVATGAEKRKIKGLTFALSPDGGTIASQSAEVVHLWEVEAGAEPRRFEGHKESIHALAFSPDSGTLASGSEDKTVRLWSLATGAETRRIEAQGAPGSLAFFPDGKTLLSSNGALHFWTLEGAPLLLALSLAERDAGYILTAGAAPRVEILGPDRDAASASLLCRVGALSFPFELCRERFEATDLAARALAADASYAEP